MNVGMHVGTNDVGINGTVVGIEVGFTVGLNAGGFGFGAEISSNITNT